MMGSEWRTQTRSRRSSVALVSLPVVIALVAGACGTTDEASNEPLPPIRTTTSTTTIPGTTIPEGVRQFYVIKSGDTLAKIASSFDVTMRSLIELNNIENPDNVSAGATLEIPAGIVVIANLPTTAP
ncbi:LysM peptidoglycan-binding domain-containing protein [Ilumatobacter sp.]|jgi:LysM repeat protein|uniref:LysM peptidoglycan-binding domain-containing protein n=1 Tax=Ilumatobacter sp. TaxID=1967498 RepID=UPI0030AFD961|tara:strand:+ start:264 stop:644 length:381 start_codon:yes stop_codon:yes gene_type:complete